MDKRSKAFEARMGEDVRRRGHGAGTGCGRRRIFALRTGARPVAKRPAARGDDRATCGIGERFEPGLGGRRMRPWPVLGRAPARGVCAPVDEAMRLAATGAGTAAPRACAPAGGA